jgi:hypothetical protein
LSIIHCGRKNILHTLCGEMLNIIYRPALTRHHATK